ncbi:MAG: 23S rRNA (uracil(1939)-C(5))-methyltransferase RlmD [Clostridia bacterium]|nr:23S rRNA (uracil(1939)-C(5))-methyltransferase RlmD [Clostridia bacterium]
MKQSNPFLKNQELTLEITGITSEGQGVARCEGVAFFVPFALPGEIVVAHIIKIEKKYCIAKAIRFLKLSEHRVEPVCEAYEKCGGCALMHLDYSEQLKTKTHIVRDALERLGGFTGVEVQNTIGMDDPWRYRNKGSFPIGFQDGVAAFGFYAERSHRLIPLYDCPIEDARITALARSVTEWANRNHVRVYDEQTGKGCLRACVIRITSTGERMVTVVTKGELPAKDSLVRMIDVDSLYHNRNDANTNVIFGDHFTLLKGKPQLVEQQSDLVFAVSPQSFLQVNPVQTRKLYDTAIRLLDAKPDETVADVYCGIGTISLAIAKHAGKVIGIECVPEAIEDAKQNAAQNGVENVDFICGLAEDVLPDLVKNNMRPDAIVIDPPRKGCDERVLSAIAESGANRIVYVSCNPATLARDLKILSTHGFMIRHVQPIDMFPHTQHVETVCCLYCQK